ncbi:hypothetical protein [Brachybacterium sp. FME24]|uniref:hypothetical protein n=1 Tax=Brachybacterium sp. FME24 TaxID=2742605 RepID=UPI00186817A0|nr:hypothetical protein [Brachybacterium sp. FME24]
MSQPPQNGWGQPPSGEPHGQPSPNGGYGQEQQGAYGQLSADGAYGQDQQGGYGQPSANSGYGQAPQGGYGQPSADNAYGQDQHGGYGQDSQGGFGQASPNGGFGQDPAFAPSFGGGTEQTGQTGQGFTPQPPEKKGGGGKLAIIICAGCAVLALLLIIVGGGIFLFTRGGEEPIDAGGTATEETTEEEPTDEATTEEEPPTEEETSEEATTEEEASEEAPPAGDGEGSKDSPYALGETFTIEDGDGGTLDVTLGEVNWDATDAVMESNSANTQPGEEETYLLVPVSVTYHGDGTAEPLLLLLVDYVSDAGNTYTDEYAITPKTSLDVGTLHDGGSGEWEVGIIIPTDQAKTGAFTVSALLDFSNDPVWVAAG